MALSAVSFGAGSATGFSIEFSRLAAALRAVGSPLAVGQVSRVQSWCSSWIVRMSPGIKPWRERSAGCGDPGRDLSWLIGHEGADEKYADRRGSPCVVIQGSDERAKGEVQIKDLIEGAKAAESISDNAEWKALRPAQFSVREDELVTAVKDVLARHFSN